MAELPLPPRVIAQRIPRFLSMLKGSFCGSYKLCIERFLGLQRFRSLQHLHLG
ncbi:MAG: hypothetical protein Q8R28_11995 [Dehalococcoidia bacterium]|nr:hypothetical protein [Dehalococcoidia bacterium]